MRKKILNGQSLSRENETVLAERVGMFHTWRNRISPYISRHLSRKSFVEDSISAMLHILSPPTLRPVAVHLLAEKEKRDLVQLVNLVVCYAITYKNVKSGGLGTSPHDDALDASSLSLDPPLRHLIYYEVCLQITTPKLQVNSSGDVKGNDGASPHRKVLDKQGPTIVHKKPGPHQTIFCLPPSEVVEHSYSCALERSFLYHGRMYVSKHKICFHSNVFSNQMKVNPLTCLVASVNWFLPDLG